MNPYGPGPARPEPPSWVGQFGVGQVGVGQLGLGQLGPLRVQAADLDRSRAVRVGDAERDQAVAALGDHFAAGRISQEEFDERAGTAIAARFRSDLAPLFADLPESDPPPGARLAPAFRPAPAPMARRLLPVLALAVVVTAAVLGAPWLLWGLLWMAMLSGFFGRQLGFGPWGHWHGYGPPPVRGRRGPTDWR